MLHSHNMHISIYIYIHTFIDTQIYLYLYVRACECMFICTCISRCIYTYKYNPVWLQMCACMRICACVYIKPSSKGSSYHTGIWTKMLQSGSLKASPGWFGSSKRLHGTKPERNRGTKTALNPHIPRGPVDLFMERIYRYIYI